MNQTHHIVLSKPPPTLTKRLSLSCPGVSARCCRHGSSTHDKTMDLTDTQSPLQTLQPPTATAATKGLSADPTAAQLQHCSSGFTASESCWCGMKNFSFCPLASHAAPLEFCCAFLWTSLWISYLSHTVLYINTHTNTHTSTQEICFSIKSHKVLHSIWSHQH